MDTQETARHILAADQRTPGEEEVNLLSRNTLSRLRQECDELGSKTLDKLLTLSRQTNPTRGCPLPQKDLYATLVAFHDSDPVLQEFWNQTTTIPSWVNWEEIQRGQLFFYRYAVANIIGFALQGFIGEPNATSYGNLPVVARSHRVTSLDPARWQRPYIYGESPSSPR
jgi:hypothetical protein